MTKRELIQKRASLFKKARNFFDARGVLEVDTPALSPYASIDAHIDLIPATFNQTTPCYLFSSPEYGMKKLLSEGSGDIYQLSHVFRDGELGPLHHPEFMMAEWYRIGFTFQQMIDETLDFIRLFVGDLPATQTTYRELILQNTGIDPLNTTEEELIAYLKHHNIPTYSGIELEGLDGYLAQILATLEPNLGKEALFVLSHYPASQAALAKTLPDDTAERFEVYYRGIELANGYHELADAHEQEKRLHEQNALRQTFNKKPLPLDLPFLKALSSGLPDCSGVAVGVDRLIALHINNLHLNNILVKSNFELK